MNVKWILKKWLFNFFKAKSNFKSEVNIIFSSLKKGDANLLTDIENTDNDFYTDNKKDSLIFQKTTQ